MAYQVLILPVFVSGVFYYLWSFQPLLLPFQATSY
jgi:hypothetical protein